MRKSLASNEFKKLSSGNSDCYRISWRPKFSSTMVHGHQWVERTENERGSTNEVKNREQKGKEQKKDSSIAYFSLKLRTRVFVDLFLYSRSRYVFVRAARERECASKHDGRPTGARFSLLPPLSFSLFLLTLSLSFHLSLCLWSSGSSYCAAACIVTHNFFPSSAL